MPHHRRRSTKVATGAALAMFGLAAGAAATTAPPLAGARYQGRSDRHGKVDFHVAANGRRITTYVVTGRLTCNQRPFRGGRFHWRLGPSPHRREPPIRIRSDSTFAITVHTRLVLRAPHGGVVRTVRGVYTLKGHFATASPARDGRPRGAAAGTLRAILTGAGGLRCVSGTRRWSAHGRR